MHSVKVGVRVRPHVGISRLSPLQIDNTDAPRVIRLLATHREHRQNVQHVEKDFCYDRVYTEEEGNDEVSADFVGDMLEKVLGEENSGTLLCYGQTGSGKTHTMGLIRIIYHPLLGWVVD